MSVYHGDRLENIKAALASLFAQSIKADIYLQQDGAVSLEVEQYLNTCFETGKIAYLGKRNQNIGLAKSLNELLQKVVQVYQYIVRMDADDISVPGRIDKQLQFMKKYPEIDIVGGYIEEFSEEINYRKIVIYPLEHKAMFSFFAKRVPLAHVTVMYRYTFFEKAGFYPTESPTNEDTLLWMKGFQSGCRFANIPEILVKVRVGPAFFSRRGGSRKAWSDLQDRILVIKTLGYNISSYFYAWALFMVNIAPSKLKLFLYKRLR